MDTNEDKKDKELDLGSLAGMTENSEKDSASPKEEGELERIKREREEYLDGWQRAKADFINYKREESAHLRSAIQFGMSDIMRDLLVVLDSFDLGLRAIEAHGGEVDKGTLLIRAQLEDVLRRRGLIKIETTPGDTFDPSIHEAMAEIDSELPEGAIADVIEPGYKLDEKVLRPARVRISKGREDNESK